MKNVILPKKMHTDIIQFSQIAYFFLKLLGLFKIFKLNFID
jgi:hypothetical protein